MSIDYQNELQKLIKAFDDHGGKCGVNNDELIVEAIESARATLDKSEVEEKLEDSIEYLILQCRPMEPEIAAELTSDVLWRLYDDDGIENKDSSDDDEMYNTFGQAKRSFVYDGSIDDWPNRETREATIYGLKVVLARWGNTTQQTQKTADEMDALIKSESEQ